MKGVAKCMLCGGRDKKVIARKTKFNMNLTNVVCLRCGFVYQSPRVSEEFTKNYYSNFDYLEKNYHGSIENTFNKMSLLSGDRLRYLERHNALKDAKTVFEVGCGCGSMLQALAQLGKNVKGVEIDKKACNFIRDKLKLEILCSDFESIHVDQTYDLVVAMHVLEHIRDARFFCGSYHHPVRRTDTSILKCRM